MTVKRHLFQENHANFLHRRSRYQEAIVHYDRSIELGATKHAINFEKGHCNIGIGNYREAISLWQQCTEDEPTNSQYHFNLGWIYQRTKSYAKALACYKKGHALDPGNLGFISNSLYSINFSRSQPIEEEFLLGKEWEEKYKELNKGEYKEKLEFKRADPAGRKIKVGFMSAELGNHAIGYFLATVL